MSCDLLVELVTENNHILELVREHGLLRALVVPELSFPQEVEPGLLHHSDRPSELIGTKEDRFGPRFPDMTEAYSKELRTLALAEGKRQNVDIYEGVYAAVPGPSYETPAEIRFLRTIGADVVGMSTVAEVVVARHCGMKVLAISVVTNMAAGIVDQPINHAEVLEIGQRIKGQFSALLRSLIPQLVTHLL